VSNTGLETGLILCESCTENMQNKPENQHHLALRKHDHLQNLGVSYLISIP